MRLTFLGAAHEVTGSCFYLEACGLKMLVDCGMEQGPDQYENQEIPVNMAEIDFVFLTHAHIDHSGCIPLLYAKGFRGIVYTTEATSSLCEIMLRDCAHIQMFEAEWRNRKGKRAGKEEYVPLYNMEDAIGVMEHFRGCGYEKIIEVADGVHVRFTDAGHLLGSASVELWLTEDSDTRKIVFSGDIGNQNQPLIRDVQYIKEADYVVMESTYGDRSHGEAGDYTEELAGIIDATLSRGGNVIIPSFAVGRTQELLYHIRKIKEQKRVKSDPDFEVYVDSPLAIEATQIFKKHMKEYFDDEALYLLSQGVNPIGFDNLKLSVTSDDSIRINSDTRPKVIISASGMCEAGRIKHHLKHNLWRKECTVLFAGHQVTGTLGRIILDGAERVKIFGEEIEIKAEIRRLTGSSAHADNKGLIRWISSFKQPPQKVFVVHGQDSVCELFKERLIDELGLNAMAPYSGTIYDLKEDICIKAAVPVKKKKTKDGNGQGTTSYDRLFASGERLLKVIQRNEGGANKDLAKFMSQINSLCDKWDR